MIPDPQAVREVAERKLAWLKLCEDNFPEGHAAHPYQGDLGKMESEDDKLLVHFAISHLAQADGGEAELTNGSTCYVLCTIEEYNWHSEFAVISIGPMVGCKVKRSMLIPLSALGIQPRGEE